MLEKLAIILTSVFGIIGGANGPINSKVSPKIQKVQFNEISCSGKAKKLVEAAKERTSHSVTYDGRYIKLKYPGGDVPDNIGVCTDLVVRCYRKLGIDLQKRVHEDMVKNFHLYPKRWGLKRADKNIDHRRVPNLRTFFKRYGKVLPISENGLAYKPGELITWMLPGNLPHIGIVSDQLSEDGKRALIIHNIGQGPVIEDMIFSFKITDRFLYELD